MNEFAILAFVIAPVCAVVLGYVAMRLHEREADRLAKREAAE